MPNTIKSDKIERRFGEDRRKVYNLNYFENNGIERRHNIKDRRESVEQKKRWDRLNKWHSVYNGHKKLNFDHFLNSPLFSKA